MFNKAFGLALLKEAVLMFVAAGGAAFLEAGTGLSGSAAGVGLTVGVRAVIGLLVRKAGEDPNSPHL